MNTNELYLQKLNYIISMEEKEVVESEVMAEVSIQEQKRIQKEEAVKIAAYKKQLKEENEFLQLRVTNMELQVKLFQLNNAMNKIEQDQEAAYNRAQELRAQQEAEEASKDAPILNLKNAGLVGADGSPLSSQD